MEKLPADRDLRARAGSALLAAARHCDATDLAGVADDLLQVLDPEGTAAQDERHKDKLARAAHLNRALTIRTDNLGGATIRDAGHRRPALGGRGAHAGLRRRRGSGRDGRRRVDGLPEFSPPPGRHRLAPGFRARLVGEA